MKLLESLALLGCLAFGLFIVYQAANLIIEITGGLQ